MASREERKESRQRIKEIYSVAKKYNVSELISESRKPKDPAQGEYDEGLDASGLRKALEELGPAYVKLGQLLCTRPDLVGNDIAEELTKLRDNTPVTPFEEIKEVIETQLGQPKIGKAIIFKKMFEDLMAKKERKEADFSILIEHIEVWKEESPDDLNAILASILVKAQDASPDDIKAEYEQAKAEYHAEDE